MFKLFNHFYKSIYSTVLLNKSKFIIKSLYIIIPTTFITTYYLKSEELNYQLDLIDVLQQNYSDCFMCNCNEDDFNMYCKCKCDCHK